METRRYGWEPYDMYYLQWSKVHRTVRYELTGSGAPPVPPDAVALDTQSVRTQIQGPYGDPELRSVIGRRYGVDAELVLPVPGTSSANFIALAAASGDGGHVLVEHPGYDPLARAARLIRLNVAPLERLAANAFEVSAAGVESRLDAGVRAVMLTNCHNPSGCLTSKEDMQQIASLCALKGAALIVDEVYLDGTHLCGAVPRWTAASLGENVVATSSLTKVYGLGGLRAGWLLASGTLMERARYVVDLLNVNQPAPATGAALCAFEQIGLLEERFRGLYRDGQSVFRRWLDEESLVHGYENHGALFELVQLPAGVDPDKLNDLLVQEFDTQVVSGRFFGLDDHVRVGTAVAPELLREGLARISRALRRMLP